MGLIADSVETLRTGDSRQYMTGFKNYLINGNFDVWQRGTSQSISGYGSDDRWANINVGSTKTHSQVACTDTERALFNASYFSRTVVSSVAGASNFADKYQHIENVTKLAGKTVTISFWAKADSNKKMSFNTAHVFGTGGTPTAPIYHNAITINLTSIWTKFTHSFSIPSIAGKTLGTDGVHTTSTILSFQFDAGSSAVTSYFPGSTVGQQSGTFDIAQVQLEEGAVATPFEQRPYGLELSLCQRYYEKVYYTNWAYSPSALIGAAGFLAKFNEQKRVVPTLSALTMTSSNGSNTYSTDSVTDSMCRIVYNSTGSGVCGVSGNFTASAEL